ncbi:hypothetical protein [Gordonia rubripertincta]|uniref:Uncharacterized protein n=1 Tax=Gordonia rubripertincta TaxID=36822 RepID=A0ABT4N353_GORRU|nr:hypothetical protein [Gordonia rubripertincta]MCZ4553494.1 hypothetical protein [Gordonia rubripertincta]
MTGRPVTTTALLEVPCSPIASGPFLDEVSDVEAVSVGHLHWITFSANVEARFEAVRSDNS